MNTINNFFAHQKPTKKDDVQLSVFYTNDMHGDVNRLAKLKKAKDSFEKQDKDNSSLALTAGDCFYGTDAKRISLITKVLNLLKFDALALGNHEFVSGTEKLAETLKDLNATAVSANLEVGKDCKLQDRIADKKFVKSAVFMKGGHKFAVIGASPYDAEVGITEPKDKGVRVKNLDKTIEAINEEAKSLEKQGVNKIILLSHLGYGEKGDLKVARETEGVDIIVGGHSHKIIDGVNTENKGENKVLNLVKSKRGENVVITQAGKLNQKAGFLDVVFDKNGVLKTDSIKNSLVNIADFEDDKTVNKMIEDELGKKVVLAKVVNGYTPKNEFEERFMENPLQNALADAILERGKKSGVQSVLFAANTLKGGADGEITNYSMKYETFPYDSKYVAMEMTEKDIVDLINSATKSVYNGTFDPTLFRCAGMKYAIAQNRGDKPLTKLELTDENGKVVSTVDVNNPSTDKKVKVALDSYLFYCDYSKGILNKYKDSVETIGNQQEIFTEYLNKKGGVLDLSMPKENRVEVKYDNLETICPQYTLDSKNSVLKR